MARVKGRDGVRGTGPVRAADQFCATTVKQPAARSRHPRPTIIQIEATASMAALQTVARCARSATPTMDAASTLTDLGAYRNDGRDHASSISNSPRRTPDHGPCHRSTGSHAGSHTHERRPTRPDGSRQQPWAKPERANGFERTCGGLLVPTDQKVSDSSHDSNRVKRSDAERFGVLP